MSPALAGGFLSRGALTIDISSTPLSLQKSLQADPMLITEVHSPRNCKGEKQTTAQSLDALIHPRISTST